MTEHSDLKRVLHTFFSQDPEKEILKVLEEKVKLHTLDEFIGPNIHEFMEMLTGLMIERCDNILANTRDDDIREAVLGLFSILYSIYYKSYCLRNGIKEVPNTPVITNVSELSNKLHLLRNALESNLFDLVLLPRSWNIFFFKQYYPSKENLEKITTILSNMRHIIKYIMEVKGIKQHYGKLLNQTLKHINKTLKSTPLDEWFDK